MTQRDETNGETTCSDTDTSTSPYPHLLSSSSMASEAAVRPVHQQQGCNKRLSLDSRMTSWGTTKTNSNGTTNTTTSSTSNNGLLNYGLLITLDDDTGSVQLSFCPDEHYPDIHPNAYAPAALSRMHKLGGGGSGVAVFEGHHPVMGDVVMKHGGDKDLKELFALATIAEELQLRGNSNNSNEESRTAARHLQERIPEFKFIFISPNHLGEKRRELWHRLAQFYKYSSRNLLLLTKEDELQESTHGIDGVLNPVDEAGDLVEEEEEEKTTTKKCDNTPKDNTTVPLATNVPSTGSRSSSEPTSQHIHPRGQLLKTAHIPKVPSRNGLVMSQSGTVSGHRDISVYSIGSDSDNDTGEGNSSKCNCAVELLGDSLNITIPHCASSVSQIATAKANKNNDSDTTMQPIMVAGNGYQPLKAIVKDLHALMQEHKWKLTLGQKRIGGANPKTGNQWLYAGKLEKRLLDNLITEKIRLVRDLATLTTIEEQDPAVMLRMQKEIARFEEEDITAADISVETDSFVANCIKKNFQDDVGRFPVLTRLGRQFRELNMQNSHSSLRKIASEGSVGDLLPRSLLNQNESMLVLTPVEEVPAHHLGSLTRLGALMGDTFENVPYEPSALEMHPFIWRNILRQAVQPRKQSLMNRTSTLAQARIWTCGLTDAGIHNLFLTEQSVWLFDLGSPQLYSAPGFLTKFLFSFFHTLGMEERLDDDSETTWVCRFKQNPMSGKLRLTPETKILLAQAYSAFETTLDRLILELFDGDQSLRWLLIQYVTLQLISDASFCLQRWTIKGGGRTRDANHQKGIEKWLWRALWDLYVAFDINTAETWTRLDVSHPSHRESVCFADMKDVVANVEEALATLQGAVGTE